jgi:hypothetical protein
MNMSFRPGVAFSNESANVRESPRIVQKIGANTRRLADKPMLA